MFIHVNRPQTYTFVFDGAKQKQKNDSAKLFCNYYSLFPYFLPKCFLTTCKVSSPSAQTTASAKAKAQTPSLLTVPNLLTSKPVLLVPNIANRHTTQTKYPPPCLMPTRDTTSYSLSKSYDMSYFVERFNSRSAGSVGSFFCYAVEKLFVRRVLLNLFADRLSVSYDICG